MGSTLFKKCIRKCSCTTPNLILVSKYCVPYNLLMSESVICLLCMSHECRRISPWYCSSVLSYCSITIPMWIFLVTIFFYELQIPKYLLCRLIICLSLKNRIICHFINPTLPHATQRLMMAVRKAPQECAPGENQFQFYSYAISIKSPLSIYMTC